MAADTDEARVEGVLLSQPALKDSELAALAVEAAKRSIESLEELGLTPSEALRARAMGDPERVAAFVARHSRADTSDVA